VQYERLNLTPVEAENPPLSGKQPLWERFLTAIGQNSPRQVEQPLILPGGKDAPGAVLEA
jgi:hypothetical protein